MSLLEKMRDSRKSPLVLKLRLIAIRSSRPKTLIFVFEGADDVPVFEEWLSRMVDRKSYEPIHGSGKEQLIALNEIIGGTPLCKGVYLFVDADFDDDFDFGDRVFVLDSYSVENSLCASEVVESLLRDEFRCVGEPDARDAVRQIFNACLLQFYALTKELNRALFIARREAARVTKKPEHIKELVDVRLMDVQRKMVRLDEVFESTVQVGPERRAKLEEMYEGLPLARAIRGKYALQFLRLWLKELSQDRRAGSPLVFPAGLNAIGGEPENASLRRLAGAAPLPARLSDFHSRAMAEVF